jgi:protein tyrosine phosphatase (PTP) superfamily phosphohydrolase (DUF442 family)
MVLKAWNAAICVLMLAAGTAGAQQPANNGVAAPTAVNATTTVAPATPTGATPACSALNWSVANSASRRHVEPGLPDFGQLNANVWRSGQPTQRGYARLGEMHVKTIVNLRAEFPQEKDHIPAGVQYFYIPITDQTAPTPDQAKQFLQIVSNPANWPILVHCTHGEGRTGVMCALVRYSFDGWDNNKIQQEIRNFRIAFFGLIKTKLCGSQQRFLQQWEQDSKPGEYLAANSAPAPAAP